MVTRHRCSSRRHKFESFLSERWTQQWRAYYVDTRLTGKNVLFHGGELSIVQNFLKEFVINFTPMSPLRRYDLLTNCLSTPWWTSRRVTMSTTTSASPEPTWRQERLSRCHVSSVETPSAPRSGGSSCCCSRLLLSWWWLDIQTPVPCVAPAAW